MSEVKEPKVWKGRLLPRIWNGRTNGDNNRLGSNDETQ